MSAKVERLVNLTVALLETRRPLTLNEIRAKVPGYEHADHEASRRMFERDKDDLRSLGVPVQTKATDPFEAEWGYLVDRREYALAPVDLSPDEVAALSVALEVTGEEGARLGLAKLTARAPGSDVGDVTAPSARVDVTPSAVLDVLYAALADRQSVRFDYRTAVGAESERRVDPYGLAQRRGDWYVVGRDHERDGIRAFRLDRIVTAPRPAGAAGSYEVPANVDLARAVAGPPDAEVNAEVALDPGVAWQATARGAEVLRRRRDGWVVVRFASAHRSRLLGWILGLGAAAEVLRPAALREAARDQLVEVLATLPPDRS